MYVLLGELIGHIMPQASNDINTSVDIHNVVRKPDHFIQISSMHAFIYIFAFNILPRRENDSFFGDYVYNPSAIRKRTIAR